MSPAQAAFQAVISFVTALVCHYMTGAPLWLLLVASLVAFTMNLSKKVDPKSTTHYVISNGNVFGVEAPKLSVDVVDARSDASDSGMMDFDTALGMVAEGWAVARESKLDRVVFRPNPTRAEVFVGTYQVGSMDEDTGECTSSGPFAPLPDDDLATDWMLLCTEPKLLDD